MAGRQCDELLAADWEEWIGADEQARRRAAATRSRRPHRFRARCGIQDEDLQAERARRRLDVSTAPSRHRDCSD